MSELQRYLPLENEMIPVTRGGYYKSSIADARIADLERQLAEANKQIEQMKCCGNCSRCGEFCNSMTHSACMIDYRNWKLKEVSGE